MSTIEIPLIDDFHIHLRGDERMPIAVSALEEGGIGRALVMPNIIPPVLTATDALAYKRRLQALSDKCEYLMAIKLTTNTTPEIIKQAKSAGVLIGKLYPAGVTTNSEDGIKDVRDIFPILENMQDVGLPLAVHAELPGAPVLTAEKEFIPELQLIHENFPKLKIIFEHISSAAGIEFVKSMPDVVAATITTHHLALTVDDILSAKLNPHHYCMPVVKTHSDRAAIIAAVKSGSSKFFFGSDSAPHFAKNKERAGASPGIYSSPITASALATIFEENDMLDRLSDFVGTFGADFYGLEKQQKSIQLVKERLQVADSYDQVVPMWAGEELKWNIKKK